MNNAREPAQLSLAALALKPRHPAWRTAAKFNNCLIADGVCIFSRLPS
jgi:hypothetical protein